MADRLGNRHRAGGSGALSVVRFGRDEMNQHERPVDTEVFPGEPVALGADADGRAVWTGWTEDDPVYVVEEASGRGMNIDTEDGYTDDPSQGDTDIAPGLKCSGGGLNIRVTAPAEDGDQIIESGTAITPDENDGFVPGGDNGVFALAEVDEPITIAEGETEIIPVEVA